MSMLYFTIRVPASEYSNRVERRSGPPRQPHGRQNDHEFPALFLRADFRHVLELQAIRTEHAHGRDLERVNWVQQALDRAWHNLAVAVGKEHGHLPFMKQREGVR